MAMAHSAQDLASRRGSVAAALVGMLLLEQQEEWQLDGRRVFSELRWPSWTRPANRFKINQQLHLQQLPDH
jgi:hypothetical protein